MKVAIIGSGNVGKALASSSKRAGHSVTLSSKDPSHAEAAASAIGTKSARSNAEAIRGADVIVLAVPANAVDQVINELRSELGGRIIIDVTNPLRADQPGLGASAGSLAEKIQKMVPEAKVVKAFNTAFASNQAEPTIDGQQLDGFYAGDDDAAKKTVSELVRSLGFRPIDAGPLAMALALEAMALLNINLNARNNWPWQSGWKLLGPSGQ